MKRLFGVLVLLFGTFGGVPDANGAGSSCISLGYPSVTSSATSIQVSVTAESTCKNPFGLSGGGAIYTILSETTSSSRCSGPYDYSNFGGGTISCSISLGGGLGSTRASATSSTIQIWFAYDFSTKQIAFSHPAISSKSSAGGSSGGSTSSGADKSGVPVVIETVSKEALAAIAEINLATEAVIIAVDAADAAALAAQDASDLVASLCNVVVQMIESLKAQSSALIELVQRFQKKVEG